MTEPRTAIPWWPTLTKLTAPAMHSRLRRPGTAGFSLIEILISMVLALITFLVMFQMFDNWDKTKRSTASGSGAMVTGALAMFRLERDLRLAGFGFGNASELGCTVTAYDSTRPNEAAAGAVSATASGVFTFPLVALQVVDGASGASDQVVALYGSSEGISTTRFFGTSAAGAQPYTGAAATSTSMEIGARGGILGGDLVVLAQASGSCNLVEVTDTSFGDRRTFAYNTAVSYCNSYIDANTCAQASAPTSSHYNVPSGVTVSGATGNVYVLGPRPQRRIWQIRNNRTLAYVNDLGSGTGIAAAALTDTHGEFVDVADNIVNLQAQYGVATVAGSAATAVCTPVTNPTWTTTAPVTACQPFLWAVRVALLARSDQFEKGWGVPASSGAAIAPSWIGGSFTMTNIDGTADSYTSSTLTAPSKNPNDWRHYRYRVFESTIPLKNIMWASR